MELTHPSSAEENADSIHLYVEPTSDGQREKIDTPVAAPVAVKTPNVASKELSPFCESLIHDVRFKIGFGKVEESRQRKILGEWYDDKEINDYEFHEIRDAIQDVLNNPGKKFTPRKRGSRAPLPEAA